MDRDTSVSRHVFIRREAVTGVLCVYLSLHSLSTHHGHVSRGKESMPLHAADRPCQGPADWKSRSPLTPSFRRLVRFSQQRVSRQPVQRNRSPGISAAAAART